MSSDLRVTVTATINGQECAEVAAASVEAVLHHTPATSDGIMTNHETRAHVHRALVAITESIR